MEDDEDPNEEETEEQEESEDTKVVSKQLILYLKVVAMDNMNVYIYGGKDRDNANIMVVPENAMPTIGELYTLDATDGNGFLIVAFPNQDQDTTFEIEYWEE